MKYRVIKISKMFGTKIISFHYEADILENGNWIRIKDKDNKPKRFEAEQDVESFIRIEYAKTVELVVYEGVVQ